MNQESLFTGILLKKSGSQISGVELFCEQFDPDRLPAPIISIEKPVEITRHQGEDGVDKWLTIEGEDGTWASIIFSACMNPQQRHAYTEKLAYAFGERRGFAPEGDLEDWIDAERAMKEAEWQFVR